MDECARERNGASGGVYLELPRFVFFFLYFLYSMWSSAPHKNLIHGPCQGPNKNFGVRSVPLPKNGTKLSGRPDGRPRPVFLVFRRYKSSPSLLGAGAFKVENPIAGGHNFGPLVL